MQQLDCYHAYFGGILGNYYLILLFPEVWSYELFEMSLHNLNQYSTDFEGYHGRKTYSFACEGGYYTVRLAVAEALLRMHKQATCIILRFVTSEYTAPLGVWVTREASRKALREKPVVFNTKIELLAFAQQLIKKKFQFDVTLLLQESVLLKSLSQQKKLFEYRKTY